MPTEDIPEVRSAFARGGTSQTTELRGECPRSIVNVLDAVSMARDVPRNTIVNEVLGEWAAKKLHESMLINRVAGSNPTGTEPIGGEQ